MNKKSKKPNDDGLFRNQKVKAFILTGKMAQEIVLALRSMQRNTEKERAYLRKIIRKLESASDMMLPKPMPVTRRRGKRK